MKILILIILILFLLSLLLTQYKVKDGFNNPEDSLNSATTHINAEINETTDPERRQKLVNANNYIAFIKTLIK
jgi:hypothetical protein